MSTTDTSVWRLTDTFLLRRAGFTFELLAECSAPRSAALAHQWAEVSAAAEHHRHTLLRELFPQAVKTARDRGDRPGLRQLSALRGRVGARRSSDGTGVNIASGIDPAVDSAYRNWNTLREHADRLTAQMAETARYDCERAEQAMHRLAQRPDVADAVLLLSPSFHAALTRYLSSPERFSPSEQRSLRRKLYAFLQRLAAKNETTSFFGPVTFGRFTDVARPRFGPETADGVRLRRGFVAFWAAVEVGRTATRSTAVRELLAPRRLPVVRVVDGAAVLPGREPYPLSETQRRVLDACDGVRTIHRIAAVTGLSPGEVGAILRTLEKQALVLRRCEPSSATFDPFTDVLDQLPDITSLSQFRDTARRFGAAVAEFADAAPARRPAALHHSEALFTELTSCPARRHGGATYADRSVLFEDCAGDGQPMRLPATWRDRIAEQLTPVLDFGLAVGQALRNSYRALAAELLAETGPLRYLTFTDRLNAAIRAGRLEAHRHGVDHLRARYRALIRDGSDGRTATVSPARLAGLATPAPEPAFVSPDVLLSGDGTGPLVLGELHPYVFAWGLQGYFAPDPDRQADEFRPVLAVWDGAERLATVLHRRQHKGLVSERFPGTFIEVTGSAGRHCRRVGIADLRVELVDGEPELLGPRGVLRLYTGEDDHPHLRVFAPAQVELPRVELGETTPRVVSGNVVVQRRSWHPTSARLAGLTASTTGPDAMLEVAALRAALGMPRHVYVSSPSETKPLYLDLDSFPAVEHLRRLAALGPVRLVEMLPEPERLWLRRSAGAFTSELRLSMVRGVIP